jgi:hypothetical protein
MVRSRLLFAVLAFGVIPSLVAADEPPAIGFRVSDGRVLVVIGEQPVAEYVLRDATTPRPFFRRVRTYSGVQVTRNHPPQDGDLQDHAAFHPGLWMAFGDLSGADNWRVQAKVLHERLIETPQGGAGRGGFAVENRYLNSAGDETICRETRRLDFHVLPAGWLLVWDSVFFSDEGEFFFGDQEEMGLGVRVATPLAVVSNQGGRIGDAEGRVNEREIWGKPAAWCDYSGPLQGRHVGVTIFSHPENFRPSWQHVRDYGLMVANPFGRQALTGGEASRVVVKPGDKLRLRFGVLVHESDAAEDYRAEEIWRNYLTLSAIKRD